MKAWLYELNGFNLTLLHFHRCQPSSLLLLAQRIAVESMKMRITGQVARTAGALLMALIFCGLPVSAQQTLSPEEQRIATYVDAHTDEAVRLLERVVKTESATANLAGVRRVGRIFKTQFESLGLTAKWIEMPKEDEPRGSSVRRAQGDARSSAAPDRPSRYSRRGQTVSKGWRSCARQRNSRYEGRQYRHPLRPESPS